MGLSPGSPLSPTWDLSLFIQGRSYETRACRFNIQLVGMSGSGQDDGPQKTWDSYRKL